MSIIKNIVRTENNNECVIKFLSLLIGDIAKIKSTKSKTRSPVIKNRKSAVLSLKTYLKIRIPMPINQKNISYLMLDWRADHQIDNNLSDDEIYTYWVSRFGERIITNPQNKNFEIVVIPLLLAVSFVVIFIKKVTK